MCAAPAVMAACATTGDLDTSDISFSSTPLEGKFVWHDLITEDFDAAQRFYGELPGWRFETAQGAREGRYLLAPSAELRDGTVAVLLDPSGALLALSRSPQ